MSSSHKTALSIAFCGIVTAFAVILMFLSLIPAFAYAVPAFAGLAVWTVTEHINVRWAYLCFAAAGLISFMLIPEPEANIFFIMFFGYYPTLCILIEKIGNRLLRFFVKLAVFNLAVVIAYNLLVFLLSAEEMLEGMEFFGEFALYAFWIFGNLAFIIYDFAIKTIKDAYRKLIKPKVSSLLR